MTTWPSIVAISCNRPARVLSGDVALESVAGAERGIAFGRRAVAAAARHQDLCGIGSWAASVR